MTKKIIILILGALVIIGTQIAVNLFLVHGRTEYAIASSIVFISIYMGYGRIMGKYLFKR